MIKFVLGGGYLWKASDGGKGFCEELIKGVKEPVRILIFLFARPEEEWAKVFAEDREFFAKNLPNTKFELRQALTDEFQSQVKWASVIYFRGGRTELLKQKLDGQAWQDYLTNKVVAGSSAGANVIGKFYSKLDKPGIGKGIGLLPLKIITHFQSDYNSPNIDWEESLKSLTNHNQEFSVLALREGEFKVVEA